MLINIFSILCIECKTLTVEHGIIYRQIIDVLKGGKHGNIGESSQGNVVLPPTYSDNVKRFIEDNSVSLDGHVKQFEGLMEEMLGKFHSIEEEWNKRLNDMKKKAGDIKKQRAELRVQLHDLGRNI